MPPCKAFRLARRRVRGWLHKPDRAAHRNPGRLSAGADVRHPWMGRYGRANRGTPHGLGSGPLARRVHLGRARDRRGLPSLGASVRRSGPTARGSCCTCFHDRCLARPVRACPPGSATNEGRDAPRSYRTSSDPEPVQQPLVVHRRPAEQQLRGLGPSEVEVGRVFPGEADAAVDLDVLHGGDHVRP